MIAIFEAGPLGRPDGGVNFAAIRSAIESRLAQLPHYRRKLRRIPLENHPVWVDDHEFNLDYHVRHTSLPRPGGLAELRQVAARVQAQRLDRSRPLWECWVLEGLEGGRFALLVKTHLVDGRGGRRPARGAALEGSGRRLRARRGPSCRGRCRAWPSWRATSCCGRCACRARRCGAPALLPRDRARRRGDPAPRARRRAKLLGYSIRRLQETPLTGPLGPHRRCEYLTISLDEAKTRAPRARRHDPRRRDRDDHRRRRALPARAPREPERRSTSAPPCR